MHHIDVLKIFIYIKPLFDGRGGRRYSPSRLYWQKQLQDSTWEGGESEQASHATLGEMPPPSCLFGNAEVWQRPQSAPARSQMQAANVMYTLIQSDDEYGRHEGNKQRPCRVCWRVHKKIRKSRWMYVRCQKGFCLTLVGDASTCTFGLSRREARRKH